MIYETRRRSILMQTVKPRTVKQKKIGNERRDPPGCCRRPTKRSTVPRMVPGFIFCETLHIRYILPRFPARNDSLSPPTPLLSSVPQAILQNFEHARTWIEWNRRKCLESCCLFCGGASPRDEQFCRSCACLRARCNFSRTRLAFLRIFRGACGIFERQTRVVISVEPLKFNFDEKLDFSLAWFASDACQNLFHLRNLRRIRFCVTYISSQWTIFYKGFIYSYSVNNLPSSKWNDNRQPRSSRELKESRYIFLFLFCISSIGTN